MKRAITLAGGGPAAGLHIGALKRLDEADVKFDVWALSCIGAWVGLVYNQADPGKTDAREATPACRAAGAIEAGRLAAQPWQTRWNLLNDIKIKSTRPARHGEVAR